MSVDSIHNLRKIAEQLSSCGLRGSAEDAREAAAEIERLRILLGDWIAQAQSYMKYHGEKFYDGDPERVRRIGGLNPMIARTEAELGIAVTWTNPLSGVGDPALHTEAKEDRA